MLDYINQKLVISDIDKIPSAARHQLSYLGYTFISDDNSYICNSDDWVSVAEQTLKCLAKYELNTNISNTLNYEFKKLENANKIFMLKKTKAENYKKGQFDKLEYDEFIDFVESAIFRKLKKHQKKSAYHHYILGNAADFSVPGSGKTTTALTVYEKYRKEDKVNKLFVIGPTSSFSSWKNEFLETLNRNPNSIVLTGGNKTNRIANYYNFNSENELYLTSFQSFANDYNHAKVFFANKNINVFLVVDEAHYIKQLNGKWAKSVIEASEFANYKTVLTGTPCPKNYSDLFNLFDLLWGLNTVLSKREKVLLVTKEKEKDFQGASDLVNNKISPLFYRVRKDELGLTTPIYHDPYIVNMNKYEREIYENLFLKIKKLSQFDNDKNVMALLNLKRGRIIRLRQLTSYTSLLSTAIDEYSENIINDMTDISNVILNYDDYEVPGKINALNELVKNISNKHPKVLIWSNFIGTINLIEKHLTNKGYKCAHIYGSTPIVDTKEKEVQTREKIIEEFLRDDSEINILIANPGACAESISLHKNCFHAIYYDLSYNCAQHLQSLDRIHRVGGSETHFANYYFLQYNNTIDSDIYNNLILKRDKMYAVINQDADIYKLEIETFEDMHEDEKAYNRLFNDG